MAGQWNGDVAGRLMAQAAANGLNRAADYLLAEAQELTPEDTGGLEQSARTHKTNPEQLASQVQFLKYTAVWQHEKLSFHHKKGQAKFLSTPLRRRAKNICDIVATNIKRALG